MTTRTFITGDRTPVLVYPGVTLLEMLRALAKGEQIMTGDNSGVEEIVRAFAAEVGLEVEVVESPLGADGKVDWDARHSALPEDARVVVIHADPHASHVTKSVLAVVPEDRVNLPLLDAMV